VRSFAIERIKLTYLLTVAVLFQSVSYAGEPRRYVLTNLPKPIGLSVSGSQLYWADANLQKASCCIAVRAAFIG